MKDMDTFEDFLKQHNINEAANSQDLKNAQKDFEKLKKLMTEMKSVTNSLYNNLYGLSRNPPSPIVKKHATNTYESIKGFFKFTLNNELTKYFSYLEKNFNELLNSIKLKPTKFKVSVPKSAEFTRDDLNKLLNTVQLDLGRENTGISFYQYNNYTEIKSKQGHAFSNNNMTSESPIRKIMNNIIKFSKTGKAWETWTKTMKKNTGYTFKVVNYGRDLVLYIEK